MATRRSSQVEARRIATRRVANHRMVDTGESLGAVARFSVCPHDTAKNLAGWFLLNTYLQRHLECGLHFEPCDNFQQERERVFQGGYGLVYTNPFSALLFVEKLGFVPVARPIGLFDETIFIAPLDAVNLDRRPLRIAAASDRLAVFALGRHWLKQQGVAIPDCEFQFVGTHQKVVTTIIAGQADIGFVFDETWAGLSEHTRQQVQVFGASEEQRAYHCYCVAPAWLDKYERLQTVLCGMIDDPPGKSILTDLHFCGFEPLSREELVPLQQFVNEAMRD